MPKFPFGFWNYTPLPEQGIEQVKLWADCGITLTMSPNYQEGRDNKEDMLRFLDECEKLASG